MIKGDDGIWTVTTGPIVPGFHYYYLNTFSYIGAFSGAGSGITDIKTAYSGAFVDPATFNKKVNVFFVGIATAEPERMRTGVLSFHSALEQAGVKHIFYPSPGTAHEKASSDLS
jgi:hypothetical protein